MGDHAELPVPAALDGEGGFVQMDPEVAKQCCQRLLQTGTTAHENFVQTAKVLDYQYALMAPAVAGLIGTQLQSKQIPGGPDASIAK
jgi:hypothetical protein